MYLGDGVVGMVAVAPVVLFLVSYLVYTQAPKHRYRSPESERLPMLARRLCAQLLGLPSDQFDGALIVLSTAPHWFTAAKARHVIVTRGAEYGADVAMRVK